METDNNNPVNTSVEQEVQNIREIAVSNGEKLDTLTYSVNELGTIMADESAEEETQEEILEDNGQNTVNTYEEDVLQTLISIESKIELSNQINAVHCAMFGIICGLLAIKIFIDRLNK